jgi:Zn-dependent protease with chaperone function
MPRPNESEGFDSGSVPSLSNIAKAPFDMWLVSRAALALALMVSFYLLALAVSFALLWIAYADAVYTRHPIVKLIFFCVAGALSVLWAIVPRPDKFEPPGPRIHRVDQPDLFAVIEEVALGASQSMPAEVYLVNDVNAFVTQRGGVMGFGSHRVMGLGLPLMQALSVQEFKSVLAHEFGHYHSGDVKLGPWIYKTRAAIGRTIQQLSNSILQKIFIAYGNVFLRMTHAVSRRQEFIADGMAARAAGAGATISGLRKAHSASYAYHSYWSGELAPVLGSGYLPPVTLGFAQFLECQHVTAGMDALVKHYEEAGETDQYDTHPSLRDRVAALAPLPAGAVADTRPAIVLLRDLPGWERRVLAAVSGDLARLKSIVWSDVGEKVYVPMWRKRLEHHGKLLSGRTLATVPTTRAELIRIGRATFAQHEEAQDQESIGRAWQLVIGAIGLALVSNGWTAHTAPGMEIVLRRGREQLGPYTELNAVVEGRVPPATWHSRCAALGIGHLSLGATAALA